MAFLLQSVLALGDRHLAVAVSNPQHNPTGYDAASAVKGSKNLHGRLLLVHGLMDDNVHLQNAFEFATALQRYGKLFDLMVYPNRTHSISEGPGTSAHVYQLIARYFVEHLPPPDHR